MKPSFLFNENDFKKDAARIFGEALSRAGQKVAELMKKEIGEADSKHIWISEMKSLIKNKTETSADLIISQLVGLVDIPDDDWLLVRADILNYGMGNQRSGSPGRGEPVQHRKGIPGINDSVTGYSPVSNRESFLLPSTWNHKGTHWFENGGYLADELFDQAIDEAMEQFDPMKYIIPI